MNVHGSSCIFIDSGRVVRVCTIPMSEAKHKGWQDESRGVSHRSQSGHGKAGGVKLCYFVRKTEFSRAFKNILARSHRRFETFSLHGKNANASWLAWHWALGIGHWAMGRVVGFGFGFGCGLDGYWTVGKYPNYKLPVTTNYN